MPAKPDPDPYWPGPTPGELSWAAQRAFSRLGVAMPARHRGPGVSEHDDPTLEDLYGQSPDRLRAISAGIDVELSGLHLGPDGEVRELSQAEQGRWDRLTRVQDACQLRIREHERVRAVYDRNPGAARRPYDNLGANLGPGSEAVARDAAEVMRMAPDQLRDQALRMLEARAAEQDIPADQGDQLDGLLRSSDQPGLDAAALARRVAISESPAYRSAWKELLTRPHPVLTGEEAEAIRAMQRLEAEESRAMAENLPGTAGYGIPATVDPSVMLTSGAGVAPILDIARVVPCNSNLWKGVSSAPPVFSWDTESATVSDDTPTLGSTPIIVHMMRGFIPYSFEVEMDYPGFASEMQALLAAGYLDAIAQATATGSGSGQPKGVITGLDSTAASEVLLTTAGTVGGADVFKAWNAVPERFRPRASWVMSVSAESQIRSLSSANQSNSYFTVDLAADGLSRLNGRPVYLSDYAGSFVSGSSGHMNVAVVGDFSSYTVVRRIGLQVERVQNLFQQVTAGTGIALPTASRGLLAYARAGADVQVPNGLRLLNQT